jgi:glycerate kinase
MGGLRVVVAPNAFKGTLDASHAARAIARGVIAAVPSADCRLRPIADGGDGTVDAHLALGYRELEVEVRDSSGHWHTAPIAIRDGHAVVEVASTCGLALASADDLRPLDATTLGLGDAVLAALDAGARRVSLALGGSASTDGGSGLLVALGARLLDTSGSALPPGGGTLSAVVALDLDDLDPRLAGCEFDVLADVTSPLHGPSGAACVFAPQKGATPEEVDLLDRGLRAWAEVLRSATGRDAAAQPGAGAAGGVGAAAFAVLNARMTSGSAAVAEALGLDAALADADLVITGEGRLDAQSLAGKGCGHVIELARRHAVPVLVICGAVDLTDDQRATLGIAAAHQMGPPGPDPEAALEHSARTAVARIAITR